MRSNMMFYPSEARRRANNVMSWSKVRCNKSVYPATSVLAKRNISRWLGGITGTLVAQFRIVDRSNMSPACTAQGTVKSALFK